MSRRIVAVAASARAAVSWINYLSISVTSFPRQREADSRLLNERGTLTARRAKNVTLIRRFCACMCVCVCVCVCGRRGVEKMGLGRRTTMNTTAATVVCRCGSIWMQDVFFEAQSRRYFVVCFFLWRFIDSCNLVGKKCFLVTITRCRGLYRFFENSIIIRFGMRLKSQDWLYKDFSIGGDKP